MMFGVEQVGVGIESVLFSVLVRSIGSLGVKGVVLDARHECVVENDRLRCRSANGGVKAIGSDARDENADHCKNEVVTLVPVSWRTVDMKGLL